MVFRTEGFVGKPSVDDLLWLGDCGPNERRIVTNDGKREVYTYLPEVPDA